MKIFKKRIDRDLLSLIEKIWIKYPQLRFGQLLTNVDDGIIGLYNISNEELYKQLKEKYLNDY